MGGAPIARERDVVRAIAKSLQKGDIVNAVTWSISQEVNLDKYQVTGPNDPTILDLAASLKAGGGTDLHAGLVRGYELAEASYGAGRLNRIVLISDGGANAGITDQELIGDKSKKQDKEGIYLVGVGAGQGNGYSYNDELMDVVTDKGRGAYVYIDTKAEADAIFGERFNEVMEIAARSVQLELTLPWYFQMHKFYGEEYSEDPKDIEPQHLAPADVMVFNQVLKACAPEVVVPTDVITVKVSWQDPYSYDSKSKSLQLTVASLLRGPKAQLLKGKAIVAYAEALKSGSSADLKAALDSIDQAGGGNDSMLFEIHDLLQKHPNFPKN
jgi:Ca-activated chloride channel family protein